MLTIINLALVFVNFASIGAAEKKLEIIDDKLQDMAMIEERVKHICENLDSCFL